MVTGQWGLFYLVLSGISVLQVPNALFSPPAREYLFPLNQSRIEFELNKKHMWPFSFTNSFSSLPLQCTFYNLCILGCTYMAHLRHHSFIISSCFKIAWATEKQRWWTGKTAGLLLDDTLVKGWEPLSIQSSIVLSIHLSYSFAHLSFNIQN